MAQPTAAALERAVALAGQGGRIFVATAGRDGRPHLAAASGMELLGRDRLAVFAWFCAGTLRNLRENPLVSVSIWDPLSDTGHQVLGRTESVGEHSILDGYVPVLENYALPQIEYRLEIAVDRILLFSQAPHRDVEEV